MISRYLLIMLFCLGLLNPIAAQQDNTHKQQSNLNEALLIKEEQQRRIDSLVKVQLKSQLANAGNDIAKTKELEIKLDEIRKEDSLRNIQQLQKIAQLKSTTKGFPVFLNQDTLFYLYTRTGSFNAEDRANAVSTKIKRLYDDPFFAPDSLIIAQNDGNYDIIYNKTEVIISLGTLDGLWFGKSNSDLAKEYLAQIKTVIIKEKQSHSLTNLAKRVGLVILIVFGISLIVILVNRGFRYIENFIRLKKETRPETFGFKHLKFLTPEHLVTAISKVLMVLRIAVILLIIYLSLPLLFSLFPETENWTATLLTWILTPLRTAAKAIIDYLPSLFKVVIIYLVFKYLLKVIRYLFWEVKKGNIHFKGFHADWAIPTFNILRVVLYAFMLIIIFPFLPGSGSPAFQGVSVFLGILISLGSSSAITNIIAGLVITYMRPFKIGDRVKIGEVVGDVVEKAMLVTRIRTIKNEDITVPNSMVLSSATTNYSSHTKENRAGLIVHYTVTVGFDVPWTQVYELLKKAALKTIHIINEPKPFVLQTNLNDFYISYQINAYTKEANKQAVIYSNLLENIQNEFKAAAIDLTSPNYHVVKDGGKDKPLADLSHPSK